MTAVPFPRLTGREPCGTGDPERFFPNRGDNLRSNEVKKECDACPIRDGCLDYALHVDVRGIWGGTLERERKRKRRELGIKAEPVINYNLNHAEVYRMTDRGLPVEVIAQLLGANPDLIARIIWRRNGEARRLSSNSERSTA